MVTPGDRSLGQVSLPAVPSGQQIAGQLGHQEERKISVVSPGADMDGRSSMLTTYPQLFDSLMVSY